MNVENEEINGHCDNVSIYLSIMPTKHFYSFFTNSPLILHYSSASAVSYNPQLPKIRVFLCNYPNSTAS